MNSFQVWLISDTFHSDTVSSSLTHIFYQLARNPEHIIKLREEIAQYISSSEDIQDHKLQNAEHLNGVIFEALRLHPPVPTSIPRLTPPEGLQIDKTHIPGNVTVWCSQYAIGRSVFAQFSFFDFQIQFTLTSHTLIGERVYENASSFIPERWYSKSEMIHERSAFAPFSIGKFIQPMKFCSRSGSSPPSFLLLPPLLPLKPNLPDLTQLISRR